MTDNFSDSNRSLVRVIKETQWGQTPASGNTRVASITSHTLTTKKNTVTSNTIRADRLVQDIIETEAMSDGGMNFEFAAGAIDDFLEAHVLGAWTRPMTFDFVKGTTLAWTGSSTFTITSATDYSALFVVGRRIKSENFTNVGNTGFFSVATSGFSTGVTTVTVNETTGVAESGNSRSKIQDANDVIVLNSTAIRSGTSGAAAFDSNSGNAFASARAAGQLVAGQKIHVTGLGFEKGSFTFAAVGVVGTACTVNDGVNTYTFVAGTDFAIGSTNANSATNLTAAINAARSVGVGGGAGVSPTYLNVRAVAATGAVTVTNLNITGGTLSKTEPSSGTNVTLVNFAGGNTTESGVFTITSLNDDQIFVTPTPATNANAGSLKVTIRGSMLRNPLPANIIPQSFSLESGFEDVGKFLLSDGQRVQDFSIDVNASAVVTGSLSFMGRATTVEATDLLGLSPYTALDTQGTEIMNATTDVGSITKNGLALSTAVKSIKLDGKAALRNQMAVGSKYPRGIGTGRFELTGSFQAYFENLDLFNDFLNHNTVSLGFNLSDSAGCAYYWTVPAAKLTADPIHAKGVDQDVMEEITFSSFRDAATQTMIQIDRFSSLTAV